MYNDPTAAAQHHAYENWLATETAREQSHEELVQYLIRAADDVLKERDRLVFDLRFGLSNDEPQTLQKIGGVIGVTRERVRQLEERCIRRIAGRAYRQKKPGPNGLPCPELLAYVNVRIKPGEPGDAERLYDLVASESDQLGMFIARLIAPRAPTLFQESRAHRKRVRLLQQIRRKELQALAPLQRRRARFAALLDQIAWPQHTTRQSHSPFAARRRQVSMDSEARGGTYFSAKLNREVQFESELEHEFLLQLDYHDGVSSYQEQPLAVQYEYQGQTWLYYPDVFLFFADGRGAVVEIKPLFLFGLQENLCKWKALRQFCQEHGYGLLITDNRIAIQTLTRRALPFGLRDAVLQELHSSPLTWSRYSEIKDQFHVSTGDFQALILQERLEWTRSPFSLRLPGSAYPTGSAS